MWVAATPDIAADYTQHSRSNERTDLRYLDDGAIWNLTAIIACLKVFVEVRIGFLFHECI